MSWPESGDKSLQPYDEVRDTVSGWKGKVISEYRYHNGCLRYEVAGADKDGKPESFDIETVDLADGHYQQEHPGEDIAFNLVWIGVGPAPKGGPQYPRSNGRRRR